MSESLKENEGIEILTGEESSCNNCIKQEICSLRSGIISMLQEWNTSEEPPINPNDLAKICNFYLPRNGVKIDG